MTAILDLYDVNSICKSAYEPANLTKGHLIVPFSLVHQVSVSAVIGPATGYRLARLLPKAHKPQLRSHRQLLEHRLAWNNKGISILVIKFPKSACCPIQGASQDVQLRSRRTWIPFPRSDPRGKH